MGPAARSAFRGDFKRKENGERKPSCRLSARDQHRLSRGCGFRVAAAGRPGSSQRCSLGQKKGPPPSLQGRTCPVRGTPSASGPLTSASPQLLNTEILSNSRGSHFACCACILGQQPPFPYTKPRWVTGCGRAPCFFLSVTLGCRRSRPAVPLSPSPERLVERTSLN